MQHDPDNDDRSLAENLTTVGTYIEHTDGIPDDVSLAMSELYDQIDWIERGIVEWRDVAQTQNRFAKQEAAKCRVAINHLRTLLYGDANRMFDAEKAARDWIESIGEEP